LFNVLNSLGFKINWDKSHCLRIGPRFGIECSNIFCEAHIIKWVKSSKFLGLSFISSVSFKGDWHEARGNFYKSANSILSKLGSPPPIDLALKLICTNCLPILTYGIAAAPSSSKEILKSYFPFNSIFVKLFGVKSVNDILFVQYHCNLLNFENLHNLYRLSFLLTLKNKGLIRPTNQFDIEDFFEIATICNKYGINLDSSKRGMKIAIFAKIEEHLDSL